VGCNLVNHNSLTVKNEHWHRHISAPMPGAKSVIAYLGQKPWTTSNNQLWQHTPGHEQWTVYQTWDAQHHGSSRALQRVSASPALFKRHATSAGPDPCTDDCLCFRVCLCFPASLLCTSRENRRGDLGLSQQSCSRAASAPDLLLPCPQQASCSEGTHVDSVAVAQVRAPSAA